MNKELNAKICECYNYNVGTALNLLFNCIDTESNLNRLEAAKKLIKREIELERFEYWFEQLDYNLPKHFDNFESDFGYVFEVLSKNVWSAIHEIYGGYNKRRLFKCLEYIENEIESINVFSKMM